MNSLYDQLSVSQSKTTINVFTTTWNMGNATQVGLSNIFSEKDAFEEYDIIVIGLQESTYVMEGNVTLDNIAHNFDSISHLRGQLEDIFGQQFYVVQHCYRAQLQLYVFAKSCLRSRITNVEQSIENTGFLGVFPNKGGLLVTLHIDGTKLAFISCHLAAHEGLKYCEARNASIIEILGGVRAGDKRYDVTEQFHHVFWMGDMNYRLTYDRECPKYTRKNISNTVNKDAEDIDLGLEEEETESDFESEGDFDSEEEESEYEDNDEDDDDEESKKDSKNKGQSGKQTPPPPKQKINKIIRKKNQKYRLRTMQMICEGRFTDLMKYDELNREINSGRVLNGFVALQPTFWPTFKRARHLEITKNHVLTLKDAHHHKPQPLTGSALKKSAQVSDNVDKFFNSKRMPSYCDRILYKSLPTFSKNVHVLFFESCESASSSDHKPVRAGFTVTITKGLEGIVMKESVITGADDQSSNIPIPQLIRSPSKVLKKQNSHKSSSNLHDFSEEHDLSIMEISITNLRGHKLEEMDLELFGGGSDPYLIIATDPPCLQLTKNMKFSKANTHRFYFTPEHAGVTSSIIKHNVDPIWKDKITLHLPTSDLLGLAENASIVISVWDYDTYSADDLLGLLIIPIRDILKSHIKGTNHKFYRDIINNSEIMGKLSGTITIEGGVVALHKLFVAQSKTESFITLKEATDLVESNESYQMKIQGDGCCSIH